MSREKYRLQGYDKSGPVLPTTNETSLAPNDIFCWAVVTILAAAFVCACIRAWQLSMTHDEALTLAWHVPRKVKHILLFKTPGLPDNNHLLHTLLVKLSIHLFGGGEFSARLPSLFGYALYLSACYLSLKLVTRRLWMILGSLLLAFHPYLLDFFSIARGYALGMGLMMTGLYLFLKWLGNPVLPSHSRTARFSTLLFALAVTANLSFLVPYCACLGCWLLIEVQLKIKQCNNNISVSTFTLLSIKKFTLFALPSITLLLLTCAVPIKKINHQKLFAIGGSEGFWINTVGGLVDRTSYGKIYPFDTQVFGYWFVGLTILLALLMTMMVAL